MGSIRVSFTAHIHLLRGCACTVKADLLSIFSLLDNYVLNTQPSS